jgi:hypothetical protein
MVSDRNIGHLRTAVVVLDAILSELCSMIAFHRVGRALIGNAYDKRVALVRIARESPRRSLTVSVERPTSEERARSSPF